jgi:xanthine dehydrogenase YagS FAD-binding subunit
MKTFAFRRPATVADALSVSPGSSRRFVAGGTTLIDLMKLDVETPDTVIDINRLPLAEIAPTDDSGLRIGALARNADVANNPIVKRDYPVLSEALMAGASAQLRNLATTAGNLLQRTRCVYFRDTAMPCNKRAPGTGCSAIGGYNRNLAILGASDQCIASNPSDQNVALTALDALVEIQGADGVRTVDINDFYLLPGNTPNRETLLEPGELITAIRLPPTVSGTRSTYLKLRDRASYEFALVSAAVVVGVADGAIVYVRIAMGGIGTVPWRARAAENLMLGERPARALFEQAAQAVVRDAVPQSENAFKVELARRCLIHALAGVTAHA